MKKTPLFKYSITYKVFCFSGALFVVLFLLSALAYRMDITEIPLVTWLVSLLIIFAVIIGLFLHYVTQPLETITQQILSLLTGKPFTKVSPSRNDEIGVISHFFNTVVDRVKDISSDLSEGKRMSDELNLAAQIQSDVLPKKAPENIIGLDIVAKSRASSEIGGDCFDFIQSNDDTLIYIGDVTGHGVSAGLIMMLVSTTIRALAHEGLPAKEILSKTNSILKEKISSNHFMSLVALRWQNNMQKMSFIGAGHEYILHYSLKEKTVHAIKSEGIALKMVPDISKILKEKEIDFQEGDAILLYTDGIVEARDKNSEMYDLERLKAVFLQNAHRKAIDIFDQITEDFSKFLGVQYEQEDDITMIVIKNIGQYGQSKQVSLSINSEENNSNIEEQKWDWV